MRSFARYELADKSLYIVVLGDNVNSDGMVMFNYSRASIPVEISDYSTLATVSINLLIICFTVGAVVKVVENIFYYRDKSVGVVMDDREL